MAFGTPCGYFREGKAKASTLSLSVLVAIEMFNALNALSEVRAHAGRPCRLYRMPPCPLRCWRCPLHAPQPRVYPILPNPRCTL